ncbi:hypothetical protein A3B84_01125 [Candidatus Nomurabacteria bacterium RIFCSPHIGHO2_02_FULL_35_13]|uniref:General secretion pathway GspH domain-containing protein n=2 Tax=Candidatus Nomuraibacteriota TaxID=1752729 RepID=A0A1F6VQ30_9BACT|nr:MAG: hypothetical protein UR88_C0005G0021 [Candidatus Nomurabacteria bacterium GW2011_GWA1_35_8]OGI71743.1 MAG: hypothetical protein A3B84_01125 [Candidatus Nomurabacteria bacterium RIFCSPHIGHO2_02_FULL_35_13]
MKNFYEKGISVIEMLVTVAIIGILVTIALPQFSKMKENQVFKNAIEEIMSALHNAQSQSLASTNSSEYGVYFQPDLIVIFKGKTFSPESTDNTINIIPPANISNVFLDGNSSTTGDIYFQRLSGAPSKTGTVTVSTPSYSKIITISVTGAVSVN